MPQRDRLTYRLVGIGVFMAVYVAMILTGMRVMHHREPSVQGRRGALLEVSLLEELDGECCGHDSRLGRWGLFIWITGVIYTFVGLAIVVDDYFVDSLERISIALNLSDDVAGATFMAAGSSAPELFTALIGVFFRDASENPGPGTIVGSAVFNITVIIGVTAVLARSTLELDWYPLMRDSAYYSISIILLVVTFIGTTRDQVHWWEGLVLTLAYCGYILVMKYNSQIAKWVNEKRHIKIVKEHKEINKIRESKMDDATPLPFERFKVMNPRLRSVYRRGLEFQTEDKGIKEKTPAVKFKIGAKAVMMSNRFKNVEAEKDIELAAKDKAAELESGESSSTEDTPKHKKQPSDSATTNDSTDAEADADTKDVKPTIAVHDGTDTESDTDSVSSSGDSKSDSYPLASAEIEAAGAEPTGEESVQPRRAKRTFIGTLKQIGVYTTYPWLFLFRYTIPNSAEPRWAKWYMATFAMSIVWIGIISFFMVDFASKLGFCLGLSANVMGLTILAAGTSVPDALSSVLVARDGKGDMAVSNAVGSNVFDILLGLGFPWFIATLGFGEPISLNTDGIVVYTFILFGVLIGLILVLFFTKWRLYKWVGYLLFAVYTAFVIYSLATDDSSEDRCAE